MTGGVSRERPTGREVRGPARVLVHLTVALDDRDRHAGHVLVLTVAVDPGFDLGEIVGSRSGESRHRDFVHARRGSRRERDTWAMTSVEPAPPRLASSLASSADPLLDPDEGLSGELVLGADFAGVAAPDVRIEACEFRDARLTGGEFEGSVLTDVRFVGCDLSGALFTESQWLRVEFQNCRAAGLVVAQARLRDVRFADSKTDGCNARLARAERLVFDNCSLVDADFYDATIDGGAFDDCDLRTANFASAKLDTVRFRRSNLEALRGATGLRGSAVSSEQVLPLALGLFSELGIAIDDET